MTLRIDTPWLRFSVSAEAEGQTIAELLAPWGCSKAARYKLEIEQKITLNGQPVRQSAKVKVGDELALKVFQQEEPDFVPWAIPVRILYEDELILAVSKPAGMIVHPDNKGKTGTLANAVAAYYLRTGQHCTVRPIHRLDEGTSGIVLFSKCPFFQPKLDQALARKQIARTYLAVVSGVMKPKDRLTLDKPIGRDRHNAKAYRISPTGKPAVTHVEVLRCRQKEKQTLVRCQLETGRTHQIRVHLASIQRPVVNDPLYNPRPVQGRMKLHAWKCAWTDLVSGRQVEITDEPETEFW